MLTFAGLDVLIFSSLDILPFLSNPSEKRFSSAMAATGRRGVLNPKQCAYLTVPDKLLLGYSPTFKVELPGFDVQNRLKRSIALVSFTTY